MFKLQTLTILLLLTSLTLAETVVWKATGTLTSGTGVFLRQDLTPDDPVTIRMTYSDLAERREKSAIIPGIFGPGRKSTSAYRADLNLSITVTIGTYVWEGNIETGTDTPTYSFFVDEGTLPLPEEVKANIAAAGDGQFQTFPFALDQSSNQLSLDFMSSANTFIDAGITASSFSPEFLTSGSGEISTGVDNKLSFTLEPSSLEILIEADEVVPPIATTPALSLTPGNVMISWQSDSRFRYRIESSTELAANSWTEVETRFGTGATITRTYPRTAPHLFYRIVALERTPTE